MDTLYPAGYDLASLSHTAKALKIARNSRCLECTSCSGLRPTPGTSLTLDSNEVFTAIGDLAQYGDDDDKDEQYLDVCACGHDVAAHDADEDRLGSDEFARRARVAVRMDELRSVSLASIVIRHLILTASLLLLGTHLYIPYDGQVRGFRALVTQMHAYALLVALSV